MLPLAKVLLSTAPALHTFPAHISPTQQQWAALGNILCSTVSQIPLLSCSIPWLEIQKGAKSNLHMPGKSLLTHK